MSCEVISSDPLQDIGIIGLGFAAVEMITTSHGGC